MDFMGWLRRRILPGVEYALECAKRYVQIYLALNVPRAAVAVAVVPPQMAAWWLMVSSVNDNSKSQGCPVPLAASLPRSCLLDTFHATDFQQLPEKLAPNVL
ncbi:hypothetical protein ACLKA7_004591 [Drosophila subpalustris]